MSHNIVIAPPHTRHWLVCCSDNLKWVVLTTLALFGIGFVMHQPLELGFINLTCPQHTVTVLQSKQTFVSTRAFLLVCKTSHVYCLWIPIGFAKERHISSSSSVLFCQTGYKSQSPLVSILIQLGSHTHQTRHRSLQYIITPNTWNDHHAYKQLSNAVLQNTISKLHAALWLGHIHMTPYQWLLMTA